MAQVSIVDYVPTLEQLSLLSDEEARTCLNTLLKGLTEIDDKYARLFPSAGEIDSALSEIAAECKIVIPSSRMMETNGTVVRAILVEAAKNAGLNPTLTAWLDSEHRSKFPLPAATTLVGAGIVLLLSNHVQIDYSSEGGPSRLKVRMVKTESAGRVLQRLLKFLPPAAA